MSKESFFTVLDYLRLILDFTIVYGIIYALLLWAKRSYAFNLLKGMMWVFAVYALSFFLQLETLNWIMERFTTVILLLLIIIFQPELRRFLENIGSTNMLFLPLLSQPKIGKNTAVIKHIIRAIEYLSKEKTGALIVIEMGSSLEEYTESGLKINGLVSGDLLITLFWQGGPTHDGAVIIRQDNVVAAGCLLPLTDTILQDRRLGTRHRSAIGLSERTDALVFVISEETGVISLAEKGNLTRYMTREAIETRLFNLYEEHTKVEQLKRPVWFNFFKLRK